MQSDLLDILLSKRGISTTEDRDRFLNPDYQRDLFDPYLLKGTQEAVERITIAIHNNERICVYSDYDCDGIPGAVVLSDFFHAIAYENVEFYIPDRHTDGYGLHEEALTEINKRGVKLIITIDLGITAIESVAHAKALGMEVIITDHHLPHEELPAAVAIINPKQPDDFYPFKELCGAGVAFKLVQALGQLDFVKEKTIEGWEKWLLDMVAVATLSDMVPLTGENRALVYFGLKVMKKNRRPGLAALFRETRLDPRFLVEDDITFLITPRINAASRMDNPRVAFDLLRTKNDAEAQDKALYLSKINNERKTTVAQIVKEAHKLLSKREEKQVIVIGSPSWRPGILGLVASRLTETYNRPAFVWGASEEGVILKGSCRSDGSVNVVHLMQAVTHLLESFGGHELAGGFEISREKMFDFEEAVIASYSQLCKSKNEESLQQFDHELLISDISRETHDTISVLSPCGLGNPKPTFLFRNVTVVSARQFGKHKEHLEVIFKEGNKEVTGISFFTAEDAFTLPIAPESRVSILGYIESSTFLGKTTLRLRIVDLI